MQCTLPPFTLLTLTLILSSSPADFLLGHILDHAGQVILHSVFPFIIVPHSEFKVCHVVLLYTSSYFCFYMLGYSIWNSFILLQCLLIMAWICFLPSMAVGRILSWIWWQENHFRLKSTQENVLMVQTIIALWSLRGLFVYAMSSPPCPTQPHLPGAFRDFSQLFHDC